MKRILLSLSLFAGFTHAQIVDLNQGLIGAYTFEADSVLGIALLEDTSGVNVDMDYTNSKFLKLDRYGKPSALAITRSLSPQTINFLRHNAQPKYPGGNSPRSFSLWVRKDSLNLNFEATIQFVLFYGAPSNNLGCGIALDYQAKEIYFAGYQNDLKVNYNLEFGNWYHIGATYDGDTAKLYVNGNLIGSQSLGAWNTHTSAFSSNPRYGYLNSAIPTGGSQINYFNVYHGLIDDILIYDRELNAAEVDSLAYTSIPNAGLGEPLALDVQLYPNPAQEYISLSHWQSLEDLRIVDIRGQICWETRKLSQPKLSIATLPKGVYQLSFSKDNIPGHITFIKE